MSAFDCRSSLWRRLVGAALHLVSPRLCEVCGCVLTDAEDVLCLGCRLDMPMVNLHKQSFSVLHQRLASRVYIDRVGAMFWYYRDDKYSQLIRSAKYDGRPYILSSLTESYARTLHKDGFFADIDLIVPVPMRRLKQLNRGYNQSEIIAKSLSQNTGIAVNNVLKVTRKHGTQTRKNAFERWLNVKDGFEVATTVDLSNKHILIVDDVLTTGATILACAETLHKSASNVKISVFTLAATHLN